MRISYTSSGALCALFLTLPAPNKRPRQLRSRLRAKCSGSVNKTSVGLKGPERSEKVMVLTDLGSLKMGGLKRW